MRDWVTANKPTFGTCAGLILMSNKVTHQCSGGQNLVGGTTFTKSWTGLLKKNMSGLDTLVERNYFGSQLDSFEMKLEVLELQRYIQQDLEQGLLLNPISMRLINDWSRSLRQWSGNIHQGSSRA